MLLLIWSVLIIAALILYLRQIYTKFDRDGVKCPRPIPFLGTGISIWFRKEHMLEYINRMYSMYSTERFYGQYEFLKPMLVIRDLEILKKITVKDFDHFVDHRGMVDENIDPLFGRVLITLKGQEWRNMRSALSPAFTSSKMRQMLPLIVDVGDQIMKSLKKQMSESNNKYLDIEAKDLTCRYANDVIASCAFGLKVDSLAERDNAFFKMGKQITNFKLSMLFKMFLFMYVPKITKLLKMTFLPKDTTTFFSNIILGTMSDREKHNIVRPDLIYLLMEAKQGKLVHEHKAKDIDAGFATVEESAVGTKVINKEWTDTDLVAQAVLFFLAGFETVSTAMSFALHELAVNPDVQYKLVAEIKENMEKNGGKFDYNSIQNMVFMDMVVSELLRLWPPAGVMDRLCNKDYNIGRANDQATKDYIIRKGEAITIPAYGFHRDPKYFPNPDKFDPERFSEENKHSIEPFSYMPFGLGPRNCIGSRFALCEVKVMLYQILLNFEVSPCEKTCIPVELSRESFNLIIKGGHWMRLKIRS